MKKPRIAETAAVFAAGVVLVLASCTGKGTDGEIVATVNGSPIYAASLDMEMVRFEQGLSEPGGPGAAGSENSDPMATARLGRLRAGALERLIDTELLYQEAVRTGHRAAKAKVDEQLNALIAGFESEEKFAQTLADLKIQRQALWRDLEHGLSIEDFVAREIGPSVSVTPQDARAYYDSHPELFSQPERIRARHILIRVPEEGGQAQADQARATLEELRRRVAAGEDFGALARQYSQDPGAANGGDLGYFGRGDVVEPFERAAFALEVGEVSGIVISPLGYHLIQMLDRSPAGPVDFDAIGVQLVRYLQEQRVAEAVASRTTELRANADITLTGNAGGTE